MRKEDINYSTCKLFDPPIQETLHKRRYKITPEIRLEDRMELVGEWRKRRVGVAMVRGKGTSA